VGTGNFHEGTARVYADDGLLTSDPRIADEVSDIFEFFKQTFKHFDYKNIVVSPFKMRHFFTKCIDREIKLAQKGREGRMILKMNSLIDPGMMEKIIEAGQAGVKVQLIVRGIFGLPLNEELTKNITAISIVDKYLEHSRIFLFGNDGDEIIYISSADWMPRNLNRRIEVACPVFDEEIRNELKEMLNIQLKDNSKARILDAVLQNSYNRGNGEQIYRAQEDYYRLMKNKHHIVMIIYHNPRCAKSRAGLQYLEEKGYEIEVRKYLNDGITGDQLKEIIEKTGKDAFHFVRTNEPDYIAKYKGKKLTNEQWIKVLTENPKLLQRPIVINGNKAVLANPPENIEDIM
jgi:polyphosphate kinase